MMCFYYSLYDTEPDTGSRFVLWSLIERFENLFQFLFIHSFSIVLHFDGEGLFFGMFLKPDFNPALCIFVGIGQQIA